MKTFQDMLDIAGGVNKLSADFNVHTLTVQRWSRTGFPDKYILPICTRYGLATADIRRMLKKLRSASAK